MIKLCISLFILIYVFISPVPNLKGQLKIDHSEKELLPLLFELEIEASKLASFKELKVTKILTSFHSNDNYVIHTIGIDQILLSLTEFFPRDKSFLIVKKCQSNYLSKILIS
ncbi:hypothetical protein [Bacillus sp. SA1-12]|uniref:hypothetical protein n=1 Tax=Bacillus sp. SA1-12 TaxID=1455638 RepID=UPI0012DFF52C|nr:hypothetical protein [Bacillus sp. SA1-12]